MILALLETDVACCTCHVDDDETVRATENAEKQEERPHQHKSRLRLKHATFGCTRQRCRLNNSGIEQSIVCC
jgi:hypothetical protein